MQVALAQRGKPYVWGATGPSSFDYSGLVQFAYRQAGIRLPRTTWDQINVGHRISAASLRP
ncbi:C40 family peptidase [Streptomyces sp. NPDC005125]